MNDHKVSVIVPAYNRSELLSSLLDSFDGLEGLLPSDVIIVDDCSTDDTRQVVQGWISKPHPFKALYVCTEHNSGPAKARNLGIGSAEGDIVAFTDSDCTVDRRWLEKLYEKLCSDPAYAGAGGAIRPIRNDLYSRFYTFSNIYHPPPGNEYIVGANCIYRRDLLEKAGGFDEGIAIPGGEEVSLCFSLYDAGYRFGFEENAIVYHSHRYNMSGFIKTAYNYGYGGYIVYDKFSHNSRSNGVPDPVYLRLLSEPKIDIISIIKDLYNHVSLYINKKLPFTDVIRYSLLRTIFNISYGRGWRKAVNKLK